MEQAMANLRQLLARKGSEVFSVEPGDSVYRAIEVMADRGVGALLVMDAGRLVGVVSERDYARKVILRERASKQTQVREIMTEDVIVGAPEMTVEQALTLMTERRIRHLPVVASKALLGVLSIGDLVRAIIAEQRAMIAQLEAYISR